MGSVLQNEGCDRERNKAGVAASGLEGGSSSLAKEKEGRLSSPVESCFNRYFFHRWQGRIVLGIRLRRTIISLQVEAIYENGVLKPAQELPLQEGQRVTITIHEKGSAAQRFCDSLRWTGDPEEFHRWLSDPDEGIWGNAGR